MSVLRPNSASMCILTNRAACCDICRDIEVFEFADEGTEELAA